MTARILVIDDDQRLHELLSSYLRESGFRVTTAADGEEGLRVFARDSFDVVLLDLMMPRMNGLEVCRRIRHTSKVPILMLTARGDEADRVVGLELGADDYIAKPFSPRELVARIRAVLRRSQPSFDSERVSACDVQLEPSSRIARKGGTELDLTGIEFDILHALMLRAGRVVTRESLLDLAGRTDSVVGDRTVDVHISHLRQKLGDDSRAPKLLKTVRGVGYVFIKEADE